MTRTLTSLFAAGLFGACGVPQGEPRKEARLEGEIRAPVRGDAYAFLYASGEGPPGRPALPRAVTGSSSAAAEARYLFASVPPNPYRLWGVLDVDGNLDMTLDVLAQPGAGDWVTDGEELSLQPGEHAELPLRFTSRVEREPPAFRVEGADGGLLVLPDAPSGLELVRIAVERLPELDASRLSLPVSLVDDDGDGRGDDANGDGIPDLSLQAGLRWLPAPGQERPSATDGGVLEVLVPLAADPRAVLPLLRGDVSEEVELDALDLLLVPQAQAVDARGRVQQTLGAVPPGDYELVVTTAGGQYWKVPNGLGAQHASQALRIRVVRRD